MPRRRCARSPAPAGDGERIADREAEAARPASSVGRAVPRRVHEVAAWLVHHEAGHALHESGVTPATLDAETAADTFAAVLMGESRRGLDAAPVAAFPDRSPPAQVAVHGEVGLRGKDVACQVPGGDESARRMPEFADAVAILEGQDIDCEAEYRERPDEVRGWLASGVDGRGGDIERGGAGR